MRKGIICEDLDGPGLSQAGARLRVLKVLDKLDPKGGTDATE